MNILHLFITFLYISQISGYLIGKMTKRFVFSRNNGSSWVSNSIVGSVLIAENSLELALWLSDFG